MSEGRNFALAVVLSFAVLTAYNMWRGPQQTTEQYATQTHSNIAAGTSASANIPPTVAGSLTPVPSPVVEATTPLLDRQQTLATVHRTTFETHDIIGSINLSTGDLDDVVLKKYKEDTSHNSRPVVLLAPSNTTQGYWIHTHITQLEAGRIWQLIEYTPKRIVIAMDQPNQLVERTFELDDHFLIRMTDKIVARAQLHIYPTWSICRRCIPSVSQTVHEGAVGIINARLKEVTYKDFPTVAITHTGGWLGFTDKYWLSAMILNPQTPYTSQYTYDGAVYACILQTTPVVLDPGNTWTHTMNLFVGAKEINRLDAYEHTIPADRFDLAVDFGWFYFITKPLFYLLQYLNGILGNLGIVIVFMTFVFKIVLYPLSRKSYRAMEKMKSVTPKAEMLRARYKNDPTRMQQEIWALYKSEKVNPAAGCLPQLLQMPLFFCLCKVFYVSLEMRHAPFMGWISDLSMPDPTHVFNLFGLLPFTPPEFMHIGLLPFLMGLTMVWQQTLSPQPADPMQARMMWIMPVVLVFVFSWFPSGVVLFWTLGNIITVIQQLLEKRRT